MNEIQIITSGFLAVFCGSLFWLGGVQLIVARRHRVATLAPGGRDGVIVYERLSPPRVIVLGLALTSLLGLVVHHNFGSTLDGAVTVALGLFAFAGLPSFFMKHWPRASTVESIRQHTWIDRFGFWGAIFQISIIGLVFVTGGLQRLALISFE